MNSDEAATSIHRTGSVEKALRPVAPWSSRGTLAAAGILAVVLLLGVDGSARAAQLLGIWGSTTAPDYLSGGFGIATGIRGPFFFGPTASATSGPGLFEEVVMTPLDLGRRFVATESNDSDFSTIASLLTNGQDDFVGNSEQIFPAGAGGGRPYSESWFASAAEGTGIWDFSGFRIESIALHVERAVMTSPGRDPNGNGNWTDYNFFRTLEIYGTAIPEPGSAALVALGILVLALRRQVGRPSVSR